jgi:hypothetical protein
MTISLRRASERGNLPAAFWGPPGEYRLLFATCYSYSPKGESEVSQRSRQLCARVKSGSPKWLKHYVTNVHHEVTHNGRFHGYFDEPPALVPVPEFRSSTPQPAWIARRLALELLDAGLGAQLWTGLRRISSVERSAAAWMWQRPTVQQHYQSFAVIPSARPPKRIVLIDDVITKGRTLMAAAMRLRDAFPSADIRAFALVRTMGFVVDVTRLFDPCQGEVHWDGKDAYRNP